MSSHWEPDDELEEDDEEEAVEEEDEVADFLHARQQFCGIQAVFLAHSPFDAQNSHQA